MTIDVYIPAIGGHEMLYGTKLRLLENAAGVVRVTVIDNASKNPFAGPNVIRNEENLGMIGSLRQAVEHSTADILVYMHSDMLIHERGWDEKMAFWFTADPLLACVGVVGATRADSDGGRSDTVCSFSDAEAHGRRPSLPLTPVALLDGCFMAFRLDCLDMLDWDQFEPQGYYFYDKDITLTLTMRGLHVGVINLHSEHLCGKTSTGIEYTDLLRDSNMSHEGMYHESMNRYLGKWSENLPVRVDQNWTVHANGR